MSLMVDGMQSCALNSVHFCVHQASITTVSTVAQWVLLRFTWFWASRKAIDELNVLITFDYQIS